jgi:hypothetical protein
MVNYRLLLHNFTMGGIDQIRSVQARLLKFYTQYGHP